MDAARALRDALLARGLEPQLSVRAGFRSGQSPGQRSTLSERVAALTGVDPARARWMLRRRELILERRPADEVIAAAEQLEGLGARVDVELGLPRRFGFDPEHPLRGDQVCESLWIQDRELLVAHGRLADTPEPHRQLSQVDANELLRGLERERERDSASRSGRRRRTRRRGQRQSFRQREIENDRNNQENSRRPDEPIREF